MQNLTTTNIALKEWASAVAALGSGHQILLIRKGGLVEAKRGFELKHSEFLLFPTFEHQHARYLKPAFQNLVSSEEPPLIPIQYLVQATDVLPAPSSRAAMTAADHLHIWNDALIDMRYNYRPDLPLYVILVRVLRLVSPQVIPNRASYAGCKSWVNLTEEIDIAGAVPVLEDPAYQKLRAEVKSALGLE